MSGDDGTNSQLYVASNSSRLGFKGNHSLDNGMKVIFQYESGMDLTGRGTNDGNGGGTTNNLFSTTRDTYIGLSDHFGTVIGGKLGVLNQWLYDFNLFSDQVGDLGNIWGGTGLPGRADGVIAYTTPDLGSDVNSVLAYIPENGTTDKDAYVIKLNYGKVNNLKLGGAYASIGQGIGNPEHTATAITASYDMDNFTVGGGYQTESDIGGTIGNDRDSYTIGARYKISYGALKAQYVKSDSNSSANANASQIALGYDYALDKATTVYLAYARTNNDPNVTFLVNNYGHGQAVSPAVGNDPESFSIGLVYKFDHELIK